MQDNDQPNPTQIDSLPKKVLALLFDFFTPHDQVCLLAATNRQFREIVYTTTLPKALNNIIPNQLHHDPIFSKHPIEPFKLVHAIRYSLLPIWDDIEEPWMLAAFAGNLAASRALLGEELTTTQSEETKMSTVLFCARGGQIHMLKAIKDQYDPEILNQTDCIGHNALMLACMGLHADCMAWLIQKTDLSLHEEYEVGYMSYYCLDIFNKTELPDYFLLKLALMLTDNFDKLDNFKQYNNNTVKQLTKEYIDSREEDTLSCLKQQF